MNKWFAISLGTILGVSHLGMIGLIANRNQFPLVNLPVGDFTTYQVEADKEGYTIQYQANDPKVMEVNKDISKPAGFLGFGRAEVRTTEQYTMDGSRHMGGEEPGKLSAAQLKCIKAAGGGESTGAIVGASVATGFAPMLTGIPYVGWLASGWLVMFGQDVGSQIGGEITTTVKGC